MKLTVKVSPTVIVELEGSKQKDLFKSYSSMHEVFGEKECGLCQSTNIVPMWRTSTVTKGKKLETYEYPEYRCNDCNARLALGTINDDTGTLFPQRKLKENGQPLSKEDKEKGIEGRFDKKHRGWFKFVKNEHEQE